MQKTEVQRIVEHFYELGTLRKILRAHYQTLYTNDETDNIASHSFRVTMIGWQLALAEGADVNKVIKMCLTHDWPEARSGDHNWVNKPYVIIDEDKIVADQIKNLQNEEELRDLNQEYNNRITKEVR